MPYVTVAHVVICDNRRFILQKDNEASTAGNSTAAFQLYSYSFTVKERKETLEYWKVLLQHSPPSYVWAYITIVFFFSCVQCIHRSCGVRLISRGSFYRQLNDVSGHVHRLNGTPADLLRKRKYRVERPLILDVLLPRSPDVDSKVSANDNNKDASSPSDDGLVLKRLLQAGKGWSFGYVFRPFKISVCV